MSSAAEIVAYLESKIEIALPSIQKSRHYYDLSKNDDVKNRYIYAVRPGEGAPNQGTIGKVTIQQEFEIQISREYEEKTNNDLSLRAAIEALFNDGEAVLFQVKTGRPASIILIGDPSFSAPEVDDSKKTASITFTFPILYRKNIRS